MFCNPLTNPLASKALFSVLEGYAPVQNKQSFQLHHLDYTAPLLYFEITTPEYAKVIRHLDILFQDLF